MRVVKQNHWPDNRRTDVAPLASGRCTGWISSGIVAAIVLSAAQTLFAMDPEVQRMIPPDTALLVEFNQALRALDTHVAQDLWQILKASPGFNKVLASPDVERLKQGAGFLGKSLGSDWRTALSRLTAGGVVVAVHKPAAGTEPDVTIVVSTEDAATLNRFVDAIRAEIDRRTREAEAKTGTPAKDKVARMAPRTYRGYACYQVGNGQFAVAGQRLIAANRQSGIERALDRLESAEPVPLFNPPELLQLDDEGAEPLVRITLNLGVVRQDPKTAESLKLPGSDAAAMILLGGYFDLIRRSEFASAGLFADDEGSELRVRIPAGARGGHPDLDGFFAAGAEVAAPPLRPERTIATASWYRNLSRLWDVRTKLLNPTLVGELEAANAQQRAKTGSVGFGDLVQMLGPHFRFVVARQEEVVYQTPVSERLPAFCMAIDLVDEMKFREQVVGPLERLVSAIALSIGAQIRPMEHHGAQLMTIRFAETEPPVEPAQRGIYNFNPAWTISEGHFIVGSTGEIVRDVVDELSRLNRESLSTEPGAARVTSGFDLSFDELLRALKPFEGTIVQSMVAKEGKTPPQAEQELGILEAILKRLGGLSARHIIGPDTFDIRVRIGMAPVPR